jgi:hypothetical protein
MGRALRRAHTIKSDVRQSRRAFLHPLRASLSL